MDTIDSDKYIRRFGSAIVDTDLRVIKISFKHNSIYKIVVPIGNYSLDSIPNDFIMDIIDLIKSHKVYPNELYICFNMDAMQAEVHIGFVYAAKCKSLCKAIRARAKEVLG